MEIENLIKKIVSEIMNVDDANVVKDKKVDEQYNRTDDCLPDLLSNDVSNKIFVPDPYNSNALDAMKKSTPARIAVWRAGPRYKTIVSLRFSADNALARDAVFSEIDDKFLSDNDLELVTTLCTSKDEYLTKPYLGRQFDDEAKAAIKRIVGNERVVVYIADGLSTTSVVTNAMDTFKMIKESLSQSGINVSKLFFVKYGRVPAMDAISEITNADIVCTLIGERPGLITSESMSAYISYKSTVGMPESNRNVLSNIHARGMPAVEAGVYIADLIKKMLDQKASGLNLK